MAVATSPSTPAARSQRFAVRVLIWMLLVALGPATTVGWASYTIARSSLEDEARLRLRGVAELKAERLEVWTATRRAAITAMASARDVVEAVTALESGALSTPGERVLASLRAQASNLGLRNVLLAGATGRIYATAYGAALLGRSVRDPALAGSSLARAVDRAQMVGETEFTDFAQESLSGERVETPRAFVAAPVFERGRVVGVLVGEIDNDEVARVVREDTGLGRTGEVQLVAGVGDDAVFVVPTRRDPSAAFRRRVPAGSDAIAARAVRGARGDGILRDDQGQRVFAVWRYLPSLRWGLITQIDVDEALAPARRLRTVALALTAAAALVAALIAALVARRVTRPLSALTREALYIASGGLDREVPVQGNDEFAALGRVFNYMVGEVRKHTLGLEAQVRARTRELEDANRELVDRGRRIAEGVALARQIEQTMLPDVAHRPPAILQAGLIWRPLDQVGGDLAFVEATPDGGFVAGVIDCTGHGVPAAMTAMFASALCSLAIATHGAHGPAAVLRELDRRLDNAFERARGEGIALGMDVGLVSAVPGAPLRFAGAGIGMFYADRAGAVVELAGRRRGLGYGPRRREVAIEEHAVTASDVDALYLFSDGILDEAAGPAGESLGRTRFKALLRESTALEVAAQLEAVERRVAAARGERPQRDDVTVLALRLREGALATPKGASR